MTYLVLMPLWSIFDLSVMLKDNLCVCMCVCETKEHIFFKLKLVLNTLEFYLVCWNFHWIMRPIFFFQGSQTTSSEAETLLSPYIVWISYFQCWRRHGVPWPDPHFMEELCCLGAGSCFDQGHGLPGSACVQWFSESTKVGHLSSRWGDIICSGACSPG